jgi:hypothetical protein
MFSWTLQSRFSCLAVVHGSSLYPSHHHDCDISVPLPLKKSVLLIRARSSMSLLQHHVLAHACTHRQESNRHCQPLSETAPTTPYDRQRRMPNFVPRTCIFLNACNTPPLAHAFFRSMVEVNSKFGESNYFEC